MSFVAVPRQNFETFQADGPWESGAPGWSTAPLPGWGMNPNQVLPRFQATAGCAACSGLGEEAPTTAAPTLPIWPVFALAGALGAGMWVAYKMAKAFDPTRR
jgi:hypothetical protein